ncbi:hypothetical protein GJV76_05575 [Myroides sp. BIT-d1]|uniref:DUF6850 domain-containing protein n=1 Tax=Myroides albus TaxID=2562892 RepID=A0A6I3LDL7_9FLAO|nr:DUF6850 family outer membrane beta-barrel protein [Myroides albus]MTG97609.1 hypothetical protein [Myroides albus]
MILKKYLIILLAILPYCVIAQHSNAVQLGKYNNAFETDHAQKTVLETSYQNWFFLRNNPAFRHYFTKHKNNTYDFKDIEDKNIVSVNSLGVKTKGDYLFYQGDQAQKNAVFASGTMDFEKEGTLYGSGGYSLEDKKNTLLNYVVNPEYYYPYLVSDTLSKSDQKYEVYNVQGGYSFEHKEMYYGIGLSYQGIAMSKLTDPRLSVYDSWFKVDLGVARSFNNHLISFKINYLINRQNISASSTLFRAPSVLQFNGLGMWKNTEVKATQGYERMLDIKGYGFDIAYKKLRENSKALGYTLALAYQNKIMNTEDNSQLGFESNSKLNLFELSSHVFTPLVWVEKDFSGFNMSFLFSGVNQVKKGKEYIYKSEKISNTQNLYNYVKVASNAFYHQYSFENTFSLKMTVPFRSTQSYHFLAGVTHSLYKEEYLYSNRVIKNDIIRPFMELGYMGIYKKNTIEFSFLYKYNKALKNLYSTGNLLNNISINQSYIPYLIRSESGYELQTQVFYGYNISMGQSIGISARLAYLHRNNYDDTLGNYSKMAPRSQTMLDFKLFYIF